MNVNYATTTTLSGSTGTTTTAPISREMAKTESGIQSQTRVAADAGTVAALKKAGITQATDRSEP